MAGDAIGAPPVGTSRPDSSTNRWPTGSGLPAAAAENRVSNASRSRRTMWPRTARSSSTVERTPAAPSRVSLCATSMALVCHALVAECLRYDAGDMSDDLAWRLGPAIPAHDYRIFRTAFVDGIHPRTGATKRFSLIDAGDWVNVIALTADQRVVLVRQFRAGTASVCLEIPGGMVDPGEDAATAAARELAEETGYTSARWRLLGTSRPNPAIQNNTLHSYLALGCVQSAAPQPDGNEVIEVSTRPLADVYAAIRSGEIDHALVLAAFAHYALAADPR